MTTARGEDCNPSPPLLPEIAEDVVPTIDSPADGTYPDWDRHGTRIIRYAIDNPELSARNWLHAESREAARAHCTALFGRIFETNYLEGVAFFRVARAPVREA